MGGRHSYSALAHATLKIVTRSSHFNHGTDNRDPVLHRLGDELRAVVGPDVSGNAPQDEQVGQNVDHIDRLELASLNRSKWNSKTRAPVRSRSLETVTPKNREGFSEELRLSQRYLT